jgi:hypothetical protein
VRHRCGEDGFTAEGTQGRGEIKTRTTHPLETKDGAPGGGALERQLLR